LPTTRHHCNLDCVGLGAKPRSRGDGHRSLVTPERVLSEYNEDLIFFKSTIFSIEYPKRVTWNTQRGSLCFVSKIFMFLFHLS